MRKFNHIYLLLLLPFILLFGCEQEEGYDVNVGPKPTLNTLDLLYELGDYSTFIKAVELAGMQDALTSAEQKTIFAPNDAAFVALLAELGVDKLEDVPVETLTNILEYHIATSAVRAESLPRKLNTLADNSSIFTVDAPAGTVLNGKALIVQQNRTATNGVIQGISFVLDPPAGNLVQEVQSLDRGEEGPSFSLLLYAVERAGLTSTLASSTNFTLLAPTDEAFAAAGLGETAKLDALSPEELEAILSFHLFDSARFSQEFAAGRIYTTAGGPGVARGLDVSLADGVSFSGSAVVNANHVADNGVVHVVNSLVQPYPYLSTKLFNGNPGLITYYATNSFYKALPLVGGLEEKFMTEEEFHVLSPSNFAVSQLFASLGISSWEELTEEEITEIVDRHTFAPDLSVGASVGSKITNSLGESYFVTENSKGISINGTIGEAKEQTADQAMFIDGFGYFGNPYFDASAGIYNGTITSVTKSLDRIGAIPAETLVEQMTNDPEVGLFAAALAQSGLLKEGQLYTVFAVKNEEFSAATGGFDDSELKEYLEGHVASGLYFSNDLRIDLPEVQTAAGDFKLVFDTNAKGNLAIQDASKKPARLVNFEDVDNIANNGIYHVVDREIVY